MPLDASAETLLSRVFGFKALRDGQVPIVDAVMSGADVLAILPTGGGKSLCYQLPALVKGGLTVVVSPLIALMRDQVSALTDLGIPAGALNSMNDAQETRRIWDEIADGRLRLLYVSPERLALNGTADRLARHGVSLFAIDEAHCVSQWGHDFRPEYAQLGEIRRRLGQPQAIALTATADKATRADIIARLFDAEPQVFVHGFDRPNLFLAMRAKSGGRRELIEFIAARKGQSGIVYCASRKDTETWAALLEREGIRALAYHAGLDMETRRNNQDAFLQEDGIVMVATVAFGMGIDKPDVRFVAHTALPKSIEAYYQEIGRAGRDGLPADTLTFYGLDDVRLRRLQIEESDAPDEVKRAEAQRLNALLALAEAPRCRRQTLLQYFGEQTEPCGHCDLCRDGVRTFDGTVEAQKLLSAIVRTGERFGGEHIVAIVLGEATEQVTRFGHDKLKTFGCGADRTKAEWRSLLRQIAGAGLIEQDIASYGQLYLTEAGLDVLKGRRRIELRVDTLGSKGKRKQLASAAPALAGISADDPLLAALKAWRTQVAKSQEVPAYVVFPDRTLIEIVAARPHTLSALANLHGIGGRKLERYGEAVLSVVRSVSG